MVVGTVETQNKMVLESFILFLIVVEFESSQLYDDQIIVSVNWGFGESGTAAVSG